jgi:antitoxin (DNA-binding transcriptional repressor) of toxin-antitoxin stability system
VVGRASRGSPTVLAETDELALMHIAAMEGLPAGHRRATVSSRDPWKWLQNDGIMLMMKTANITHFRANLSQILDAVRQGEEFEILDRRVPIARLVPVGPVTAGQESKIAPWIERLRRAGAVRVGSLKRVAEILKGFAPGTPPLGTAAMQAILDERRSGR